VAFAIRATPIAKASIDALRGTARASYDRKREELAAHGCKAAGYRLTGPGVGHICVVHLVDDYRLVSVFPDKSTVVVVLVARHTDSRSDVYRLLYRLLELDVPKQPRTKPPCCEDNGDPPVAQELVLQFMDASTRLLRDATVAPRRARSRTGPRRRTRTRSS
jgi:hypothetical protein